MQLKSGVLSLGGNLTTTGVTMSGSSAGTMLQLMNVKTISNASTQTTAYAAIGVTPGTALENFALTSHRWWTGSSGTNSGAIGMQLASGALTIGGNTSVGGTVSTTALAFSGTVNGTLVQLINNVSTVSGTTVTTAFAGLGITAGTAVDNYSLNGHRWWTGSSGTSSGILSMSVLSGSQIQANSTTGAVVVSNGGLLVANTTNSSSTTGNALHITGGAFVARDLYTGGTLFVPSLPFAYGTIQTGFGVPINTASPMALYNTVGDTTLQAAIGSYFGPGGSSDLGRFTAPFKGTFTFTCYVQTSYSLSYALEMYLTTNKGGNIICLTNSGGAGYVQNSAVTIQLNVGEYVQATYYSNYDQGSGSWLVTGSMFMVQTIARHF